MTKRNEAEKRRGISLAKKLVLLVALPLTLQLFFTCCIWTLKTAADKHAYYVGIASELGGAVRTIVACSLASDGYVNQALDKGLRRDYDSQKEIALIELWCRWLASTNGLESMGATANRVIDGTNNIVKQVHVACFSNQLSIRQTGNARFPAAQMKPKLLVTETQIESDLNELQGLQKQYMADSFEHPVSERQEQLYTFAAIGIVANLLVLIFLGLVFSRGIINRLSVVSDNVLRIQRKSELLPEVSGNDEIAVLDASFREMAATMREEEERQKALFEHAYNVLCAVDGSRRFLEVNQASLKVLGYKPSELIGKPVENFVPSDTETECVNTLQRVLSAEPQSSFELRMVKRDGSQVDTLWRTSSTAEKEKIFCILHDITERKAARRIRKEMVQMVSQELRAPLMVLSDIHATIRNRQFGELNEKGWRLLAAAETNANRMLRLIDDLLDKENLESGLVELHRSRTDLVPLLDQAIDSLLMLAGKKEITLTNASAGAHLIANVDANRIIQILVNLLANAIKFSPPGSTILLWLEQRGSTVEMHVRDQGRGIPANLIKEVFNRFKQVQRGDATEKGGSGLGLAICKSLVELHGGTISVQSIPNQGSDFIVQLPWSNL